VAKLVRFPPEVYERLAAAARRERRSVTAQVVRFVEEGLARLERTQRIGPGGEGWPQAAETPAAPYEAPERPEPG
jgi:hypothetical protein